MKILILDNYDSFTYNLVDLLGKSTPDILVWRNYQFELTAIERLKPDGIVISPGPGTPEEAGLSNDTIRNYHETIPILGVCLGHQCMATVFGGNVVRAPEPVHGKLSAIEHSDQDIFEGLPEVFSVTRYHSLVIEKSSLPACMQITAWTQLPDNSIDEIMGIRHKDFPIEGLQFHPESILTEHGHQLLANFLAA